MESQKLKLSLKKETITKLNTDEMKKVIGGMADPISPPTLSCNERSCASQTGAGSCGSDSCNC
jgi:bacteriocin-like protein